jgi:hypothetical protein
MKLFKDNQDNVYAYELDGSQDEFIGDKISITQEEANILNKKKTDALPKVIPLTTEEKLASIGLSVDDLKDLLGVK